MKWNKTSENSPPTDRLILVTSGICWRREDEIKPAKIINNKIVRSEKTYNWRREIGKCFLCYWYPSTDKYETPGFWKEFNGGRIGVQFNYWMEFENPINESIEHSYHNTIVPDVMELSVYVPSEDEIKTREITRMLGF